ncbi:MAG TPA: alpha/beta hydrolase [Acidimicrobiales bacterium]
MRRRLLVLVVACLSLLAAGCDVQFVAPPGAAPLRYRDEIFGTVNRTNGIAYGSAVTQTGVTQTLLLDLYRPAGDTNTHRAAIVWVHGGGFTGGTRTSAEIVDEANTFARKGFVTVSIDYRLAPQGCFPVTQSCLTGIIDAKHDAQAAVRFLRANAGTYGIDPTRIAIGGSSAGAITALNVGYSPEDPGTSGNPGFPSDVRGAVSLSGAKVLTTADPGDAPALLFHGTEDQLVSYDAAVNTVNEARAAGLIALLTTWEGAGHVPYTQHRTEIIDQTTNFLWWMMDLGNAPAS